MLKAGIVGLPNAGKTTLFNTLARAHAAAESYPFTTIEPNTGTVLVPDDTLQLLADALKPEKTIPAHIEFHDIAGLVKGAHHGEGLGNQFLSHIRNVNAIVHVVRCFESTSVSHVAGSVDPVRDWEVVETELMLADLELVERALARLKRVHDRSVLEEREKLSRLKEKLEEGTPLRQLNLEPDLRQLARARGLLSWLPEMVVANLGEENSPEQSERLSALQKKCAEQGLELVPIYGRLEYELLELDPQERNEFLQALNLEAGATERVVNAAFRLLDLIRFYTTENQILQAWPTRRGTLAPEAAGLIHSDMERGFIAVDVIAARDLLRYGSIGEARQHGCLRKEGKHYEIRNEDVCRFYFA